MSSNERIKKYLDAGTVLGQVTRARAEEIVRELASAGDIPREHTQEWVDNLVERSRKTSEQILELIRHEVSTQLGKIDGSALETLAAQVSDLLKRSAAAGRSATAEAAAHATKGAQAARGAADKGAQAARGAADKVTPSAVKSVAKKVTPSAVKKKAATSGPSERAAAKEAAATTVAAKKAPVAKKTPATKAAPATEAAPATTPATPDASDTSGSGS
jgi:polyhydroxyalkanoate synthesis regulator phasin